MQNPELIIWNAQLCASKRGKKGLNVNIKVFAVVLGETATSHTALSVRTGQLSLLVL